MAVNAGSVTLELTLDSKKFKKSLNDVGKTTKKQSGAIADNFKKATSGAGQAVSKQFESANAELQKAEAKLKELQKRAEDWEKAFRASGQGNRFFIKDESEKELKRSAEEYIKTTREKFSTLINAQQKAVDDLRASCSKSTEDIGESSSEAGEKIAKTAGMFALMKRIGTPALKAVHVGLKGLNLAMKPVMQLFKASCNVIASAFNVLNNIVKASLLGIGFAIGALALLWKQGMNDLIESDAETANSVASLRSALDTLRLALATAFAPIVNIAIPYLVKLINWITRCATAVAHLVSALTGKKTALVAKKQMGGVGKAVGGVGKSAGKANKQAKELQRTLMGFDKINKLDKANKGSGGGGGGGGGGAGGGAGGLFETVPVDKGVSKFADRLKASWKKADFTWLGALLAEKINKAMAGIPWDKIKQGAWRIAHSIGTFINGFVDKFDWGLLGRTISDAILTMFKFVTTFLETVNWQKIGKAIVDFFTGIKWGALFKGASRIVGNIAGAIAGVFAGAVKRAGKKLRTYLFGTGKLTISGFFKGLLKGIKGIGKFIVNNLFKPFIKGFKKAFGISSPSKVMKEQGGYVIDGLLEGIKNTFKKVVDWFADLPSKLVEAMGDIGGAIGDAVGGVGESISIGVDLVQKGWSTVKDWVGGFLGGVVEKAVGLAKAFGSGVSTVAEWLSDKMGSAVSKAIGLATSFGSGVSTVAGWLAGKMGGAVNKAVGLATNFGNKVTNVAGWVLNRMGGAVNKAIGLKKNGWSTVYGWIKNHLGKKFTVSVGVSSPGTTGRKKKKSKKKKRAKGGVYTNGMWRPIQSYATGGEPDEGQLFYAREAGAELVGTIGGHTAVMNNDQIVASVSSGVAKAISSIKFNVQNATPPVKAFTQPAVNKQTEDSIARMASDNKEVISLLRQLLVALNSKDTNVYLDGKDITNNTIKRINQQTRTTGQFPLIV